MGSCCSYFGRLCKAAFRLTLVFLLYSSTLLAAYNPPSTIPVDFYFNSESQAETFSNTQCDSSDYSWSSCQGGVVCAVGDPSNISCVVTMCYHTTDVNNCQGSTTDPDIPDPDPDPDNPDPPIFDDYLLPASRPDVTVNGQGNNAGLIATIHRDNLVINRNIQKAKENTERVLNSIHDDGQKLRGLTLESNVLLKSIDNNIYQNGNASLEETIESIFTLSKIYFRGDSEWDAVELDNRNFYGSALENIQLYLSRMSPDPVHNQLMLKAVNEMNNNTNEIKNNDAQNASFYNNFLPGLGQAAMSRNKTLDSIEEINNLSLINDDSNTSKLLDELALNSTDLISKLDEVKQSIIDSDGSGGGTNPDPIDPDVVTENACSTFTCSSDTPACYIARKQWELDCANRTALTDSGALGNFKSELTAFLEHEDSDVKNIDLGTVDTASMMSKYTDGAGFSAGPATCPAPYLIRTAVGDIPLDFGPLCDLAIIVRWFIIASATIGSGMLIAKYA